MIFCILYSIDDTVNRKHAIMDITLQATLLTFCNFFCNTMISIDVGYFAW